MRLEKEAGLGLDLPPIQASDASLRLRCLHEAAVVGTTHHFPDVSACATCSQTAQTEYYSIV